MSLTQKTNKSGKRERRHARIRSHLAGTSARPRISVYRSNTGIMLQLIDDESGRTVAAVSTKEVKSGSTLERAKKAGKLLAEKAITKSIKEAVFDRSGYVYAGKVKAAAEGAREGGLKF